MSEVKVRFMTVNSDVTFTMLVWVERTRVDVDVGVELLDSNVIASCEKKTCEGGRDNSLSKGGNHAAGDENILCLHFLIVFCKVNTDSADTQIFFTSRGNHSIIYMNPSIPYKGNHESLPQSQGEISL